MIQRKYSMDLRTELFGFTLSVPIRRLFHLLSGDLVILSLT